MKEMSVALLLLCSCSAAGSAPPPRIEVSQPVIEHVSQETLADSSTVPLEPLQVWVHDTYLETFADLAAVRIANTSGLLVEVNPDNMFFDAMPIFWSDTGVGVWSGAHHEGICNQDWIAITKDTPEQMLETVILHEMLHALGSPHVTLPGYLMSERMGVPTKIKLADLQALCGVAPCSVMNPEL
jgi:hypothetical protein